MFVEGAKLAPEKAIAAEPHPLGLDQEGYPRIGYAWYVVGILLVAAVTSYLDRYLISLLVEPIKRDLLLNDTQISLLQGFAFAIFYVLFGLPFGALIDRSNRRTVLVAGVALWSAMTMACGLASNFTELFVARAGVGIGEACLAPAAYSLIADYFRPAARGRRHGRLQYRQLRRLGCVIAERWNRNFARRAGERGDCRWLMGSRAGKRCSSSWVRRVSASRSGCSPCARCRASRWAACRAVGWRSPSCTRICDSILPLILLFIRSRR
jgi:hypothetical protein